MPIYDYTVNNSKGEAVALNTYRGKVLLIVNVASRCGFTGQYEGLEALHRKYHERGLVILGFPCNQFLAQEPGGNDEIQQFCKLKYDVSFPVMAKISVNGADADPLYQYLKRAKRGFLWTQAIKWNFTKFLIDREANIVGRYSPFTKPRSLERTIESLL